MKVKPAAVPTNPFPQWLLDADNAVKSWGKRVSARSELAEPFLVTTHEHGAAEEGRVASFLRDHNCQHVLVDVGADVALMLSSVYNTRDYLRALDTHLRLPPRCGVCSVLLPLRPPSASNATLWVIRLHSRGVPLLLLNGVAGAGIGVRTRPQLHAVIDVANVVHAAAHHVQQSPSRQLVLRVELESRADAVLVSHLVTTHAICRAHALLFSWRGFPNAPPEADGASEYQTPGGYASIAWFEWTTAALSMATEPRQASGTCNMQRFMQRPTASFESTWRKAAATPEPSNLPDCTASTSSSSAAPQQPPPLLSRLPPGLSALARSASSDLAMIDALFRKHGCRHAYLDVGTNIGVQIRKLFEPHKYPGAEVLPIFANLFGPQRCKVCAIGIEPNPRHTLRLNMLQARLNRLGAPVLILTGTAAATHSGVLRLSRASKAKDKWQDVGASAAPSQGNFLLSSNNSSSKNDAKSQVLVKALDLADLVSLVTSRIKEQQKGGKLLMKLDVEGTEYTLLPHLALKKHLCSIDLLFIEWHERYFTGADAQRVVNALNLSKGFTGKGTVSRFTNRMPDALKRTVAACGPNRTKVMTLDDESYMNDLQPWADRSTQKTLCYDGVQPLSSFASDAAATAVRPPKETDGPFRWLYWHAFKIMSKVRRWTQALYDEMEDEGLLWLMFLSWSLAACGCCFCSYQCYQLHCASADDD